MCSMMRCRRATSNENALQQRVRGRRIEGLAYDATMIESHPAGSTLSTKDAKNHDGYRQEKATARSERPPPHYYVRRTMSNTTKATPIKIRPALLKPDNG